MEILQSFGQDNQYGHISGGFRRDGTSAMSVSSKNIGGMINQLKLRGSYGELGNSNIPGYSFNTAYNPVTVQEFLLPEMLRKLLTHSNRLEMKDIQWEKHA